MEKRNMLMIAFLLFVAASWFVFFPQGDEKLEGKEIELKPILPNERDYTNEQQAIRVLRCTEGVWEIDGKKYEVTRVEPYLSFEDPFCEINGYQYREDELLNRNDEIIQVFSARRRAEHKNKSIDEVVFESVEKCTDVNVPIAILDKINVSTYDKVKIDPVSKQATLSLCEITKQRILDVDIAEIEKIEHLVAGGKK